MAIKMQGTKNKEFQPVTFRTKEGEKDYCIQLKVYCTEETWVNCAARHLDGCPKWDSKGNELE